MIQGFLCLKNLGFALSGLMLAMVAGSASADMDGGQLNISGLVVDNTCETRVDGGNKRWPDPGCKLQPLEKSLRVCWTLPLVLRLNHSALLLTVVKLIRHQAAQQK